jgi:hypothetical protein
MKAHSRALTFASAILALPLLAYSQSSQGSQDTQSHEATLMTPVRAVLVENLDADKNHDGATVEARLTQKVTLTNGTELPKNTVLLGKVTTDDTQQQGASKLALRFDQARLKDGTMVPVRATIVGYVSPGTLETDLGPDDGGAQLPNSWTAQTLQLDQENVVSGVDLHSSISSQNSGVFVATRKHDVRLREGSEIQFAIAPASAATSNGQSSSTNGQS